MRRGYAHVMEASSAMLLTPERKYVPSSGATISTDLLGGSAAPRRAEEFSGSLRSHAQTNRAGNGCT